MSVELKIYIESGRCLAATMVLGYISGYQQLNVETSRIHDEIAKASKHNVLKMPIEIYTDDGLERVTKDAYGDALCHIQPKEMAAIMRKHERSLVFNDKAVMAYLESADDESIIVLYWY